MECRHCGSTLEHRFIDLGYAPPSNAYLSATALQHPELWFPLRVMVCNSCWLVQTEDYTAADALFTNDYAYFSSTSRSWLEHAKNYSQMITDRLHLSKSSHVIEVAANDGYLLKNFVEAGIPCLGIEPTASTAAAAEALNIPIRREFFGASYAQQLVAEGHAADLVLGNNVYAHVPDINDFTAGLRIILKPEGTVTLEFPHLLNLLKLNQFDTIYHEHFSYLSLVAVSQIFTSSGLRIYDVEELPTHGGSLRIYGCLHDASYPERPSVKVMLETEKNAGLMQLTTYKSFQARADKVKNDLLTFLLEQKAKGKSVVAYGAAAKGNTLLNYAGIKPDLISFVCDAAPAKQGKFMPGSHIPILPPDALLEVRPDFILILPWNISTEVRAQLVDVKQWGGCFVTAVPALHIYA